MNVDKVFSALADQNRRRIVELLHGRRSTILDLSQNFDISFQALSKHLKILESAGIIKKEKKGKFVECSVNRATLKEPLKWISYYSDFWNDSFSRLDKIIKDQDK